MDDELRAFRDELRQEFASFRREVAEQFNRVTEQFNGVTEQFNGVTEQFNGVTERFNGVTEQFAGVHQRLDSLDERVRHNGVLLEAIRSDVRLLAEGHHQLDQKIDRHRADGDHEHKETRALIRMTFRELDRRIPRPRPADDPTSS